MMTFDGRYPTNFNIPKKLIDFVHMPASDLDRIMKAYELGPTRRRYYRGSLVDRLSGDVVFCNSKIEHQLNLLALFEFLGAYQVVDQLRCRGRCGVATDNVF